MPRWVNAGDAVAGSDLTESPGTACVLRARVAAVSGYGANLHAWPVAALGLSTKPHKPCVVHLRPLLSQVVGGGD